MNLAFTPRGWEDYLWVQANEPRLLRKLHRLFEECTRTPFAGSGKPEPLRYEFSGFWSRRLTDEHRLVYAVEESVITILSCRSHYQ